MDPFPGRQCVFLGITHGIDPSEDIADVILKVAYNTSAENSAEEGRLRPCGEEENRAAPTASVAVCSLCTGYPRIHPLLKAGCTEGVVTMRTPVGSPTAVSGANRGTRQGGGPMGCMKVRRCSEFKELMVFERS